MKKNEEIIVLLLFCGGMLAGLLLPSWTFVNLRLDTEFLSLDSFQQYNVTRINCGAVLKKVAVSRLTLFFLLYFSCYSAAGFWIFTGVSLLIGMSMGFFAAMAVIQMKYWGILFWCCALLPQWFFYGWTGKRLIQFMERRRRRTLLCSGNPAPTYSRKVFLDFLIILALTAVGIFSEVYLNSQILRFFLKVYVLQK